MKTAIVMPTYNRPEYLWIVLNALKKCYRLEDCFIVTSEEPVNDFKINELFDNFKDIEVARNVNSEKLGCNRNLKKAIERGFEYSDKIIILEDDIVPCRDFLVYMLWCLEHYKNDKKIAGISSYQMIKERKVESELDKVLRLNDFGVWGWAMWKDRWEEFCQFSEEMFPQNGAVSWDMLFNKKLTKDLGLYFIHPRIGRTQNIGEHGTYVPNPQWQRENQFTPYNSDSYNLIADNFIEVEP